MVFLWDAVAVPHYKENYFIMGDDLLADGVLPVSNTTADDDFDPNAVESDDFLDDPEDVLLDDVAETPLVAVVDEDDDDLLEE